MIQTSILTFISVGEIEIGKRKLEHCQIHLKKVFKLTGKTTKVRILVFNSLTVNDKK